MRRAVAGGAGGLAPEETVVSTVCGTLRYTLRFTVYRNAYHTVCLEYRVKPYVIYFEKK